jgi:hypothetical protein
MASVLHDYAEWYGHKGYFQEDILFNCMVVDNTFFGHNCSLCPWPFPLEVRVLKYFMRFKPGWWVLHVFMIGLTFYLGHMAHFNF